jgi:acetyl esterase/lipase
MQPRILSEPAPPADIRLAYGSESSQLVDFRLPAAPGLRPLAVMIHGGFWRARFNLLHAGHLCAALGAAGFASANIEYRRAGEVGCGWPGTFKDVVHAVQFARERANLVRGDARRTIVMGHSAGGHLALWLAGEMSDLAGVASLGGVASLRLAWEMGLGNHAVREFLGAGPTEAPDLYRAADPEGRPAAVSRVLIHGTADDRVPIELSREYLRLRQGDPGPVKLVELPGGDHFDVVDPQSRFWEVVLGELMGLVTSSPASPCSPPANAPPAR